MDSPQTHSTQPPLPPLPRRRPSATSIPSASTSAAQTHRRPLSPSSARGRPRLSRQASEIVLPEWQPDSSADHCPICRDGFTFWNRRHHCRYTPPAQLHAPVRDTERCVGNAAALFATPAHRTASPSPRLSLCSPRRQQHAIRLYPWPPLASAVPRSVVHTVHRGAAPTAMAAFCGV